MDDPRSLKRKISLLKRGVARLPNVTMSSPSIRQSTWQTYITKAGSDAAEVLERAARGETVAALLREFAPRIKPLVFEPSEGRLRWHFMRTSKRHTVAATPR